MTSTERNSPIELLRIVAVILITFTHTRHELTDDDPFFFFIERLPTFGTAILSIISGYLYYTVSHNNKNLFSKKVKSLAIPYLIANGSVLLLVLVFNYIFGYNPLNRLSFDYTIITEGLLALNSPPISPPTYFIRDIFIIFSIIALFTQKEFKTLFILVPLLIFGTLILRNDIVILFLVGILYGKYKDVIEKKILIIILIIVSVIVGIWFNYYLKFPVSFLLFVLSIDLHFNFYKTGRYSYLLHLYHSPVIVISYPVLKLFIHNAIINVFAQILVSICSVYLLFLLTKRIKCLKILSGGR